MGCAAQATAIWQNWNSPWADEPPKRACGLPKDPYASVRSFSQSQMINVRKDRQEAASAIGLDGAMLTVAIKKR